MSPFPVSACETALVEEAHQHVEISDEKFRFECDGGGFEGDAGDAVGEMAISKAGRVALIISQRPCPLKDLLR